MELHELISLNQQNQLNDFHELPIDVPDSFIDEIKIGKKKGKYRFDSSLGYVNNAFISNECMENQLNHSKETGFNELSIEDSLDGTTRYRTISFEKKEGEPLGITIRSDKNDNVIIARIIKGGVGTQFGLSEGDEIVQINQVDIKGRNFNINEISDSLAKISGRIQFVIAIKNKEISFPTRPLENELNFRAMFDYEPDDDQYLPCKEIGIRFRKGDILHVVDQSDQNYWQAQRDINGNCLAGLIPSSNFQLTRTSFEETQVKKRNRLSIFCGNKKKKNKDRRINLVYEKVSLFYPTKAMKRPVVLIGATNLGIFELRKMLIQNDARLATAVPHTTRRKSLEEINGYDYHFQTQHEFETQIKENRFIEYGKYNGDYYGLSIGSILAVVQSSKICLLNLNPASIQKNKK